MKKRTTAFILCLISILNLICVPAFAKSESDSNLTVTEQRAAAFTQALGIEVGTTASDELEETVTRAQWAKALGTLIDSASSYDNSTYYFKDCKDDEYANSLAALRIINGCEDGLFMPENEATVKTAYITAFRVSGFERYIELLGDSDYDLASLADKLGLTARAGMNDALTRRDAMVLLYQIGNINTYDITAAVGDKAIFSQNKDKTVLSEWRNIYRKDEVRVTANRFTSLTSSEGAVRDDQLEIGGTIYVCADKNADWKYLGYFVDIFYEDNDGDKTLVSIMRRDDVSEPLTIEAGDFTFESNTLTYDIKDAGGNFVKTRKEHISGSASVIYNNKHEYQNVDSLFDIENGEITLLTDGSGKYDTVLIRDIRNVTVSINDWATDTVYTDGKDELSKLYLEPYSTSYIYIGSSTSDRTFSNTQIEADDTLSVIMSKDGGYIEIYIALKTVSGVLNGISTGKNYGVTIDNKFYDTTENTVYDEGISAGDNVTAYIDITGKVARVKVGDSKKQGILYGYVWNVYSDTNEETAAVKLYNENTEFVKLDFAKRVRVNGVSNTKMDAISTFLDENGNAKRQLIMYGTNSDGEINYIDTAAKSEENYEGEGTLNQLSAMASITYAKRDYSFAEKYPIAVGKTRVMVIPESDKEGVVATDFGMINSVTATSPFTGSHPVALFNTDINSPEIEFIVYQPKADQFYGFLNYILIDEVTNVVSGEGEEILKITGITSGKTAVTYYTTPDFMLKTNKDGDYSKENADILGTGDLIAYTTNSSNNDITRAMLLYDYNARTPYWGDAYEYSGFSANTTYAQTGSIKKIYTNDDVNNQYMFEITELLGEDDNINDLAVKRRMPFFANKIKLLIYDGEKRTGKAYVGTPEELVDAQGIGVGDDIFITTHGSYVLYPDLFVVWK